MEALNTFATNQKKEMVSLESVIKTLMKTILQQQKDIKELKKVVTHKNYNTRQEKYIKELKKAVTPKNLNTTNQVKQK